MATARITGLRGAPANSSGWRFTVAPLVELSEERPGVYPSRETLLEDVEIDIRSDGSMHLSGRKVVYRSCWWDEDHVYEDLVNEGIYVLHEDRVHQPKFLWIPVGKPMYKANYLELRERTPYEAVTTNYRIVKRDE